MKKKIFALVLAVVMTVCMVPAAVFAVDVEPGGSVDNGLELNKTYDKENNLLTLEAWVTGTSVTTTTETVVPCDIVLVLDVSGSMDERIGESGSQDKIDALKTAVAGFIDTVAANAETNKVDHRISVVKFAGDRYYDSESSLEEGNHRFWDGFFLMGQYVNYTEVVKNLTSVSADTGVNALKTAVNGLTPDGATAADYGMTKASYVLGSANPSLRKDSTKVVVMFTDGEPNHGSGFDYDVANRTIAISKGLKADGVKVYSVGVFGTLNPKDDEDYRIIQYMNSVSSNYPNANGATEHGSYGNRYYTWDMGNGVDLGYYYNASDAADLSAIFKKIAESSTTGGAAIQLTETSTLVDQVTEWFDLPENVSADDIKVYTSKCKSVEKNGEYIWEDRVEHKDFNIVIDEESKTIKVSGFDYAENWVGVDTGTGEVHGQKLIVEFHIYDNGTGKGPDVPTNTAISGVYDGDEQIEPFPIPETDFPTITIVHRDITGEDDEVVRIDQVVDEDGNLDIKDHTAEGFLYGGRYSCEEPEDGWTWDDAIVSKDGGVFKPTPYATYYIKEVPATYLVPKTLVTWETIDGSKQITHAYLITTVDDANYRSVGFYKPTGEKVIMNDVDVDNDKPGSLWNTIEVYYKDNGYEEPTYVLGVSDLSENTEGYLACFELENYKSKLVDGKITYVPVFVTPDNAAINGITVRTATIPSLTRPTGFDYEDKAFTKFENPVTVDAAAAPMTVEKAFSTIEKVVEPEVPEIKKEIIKKAVVKTPVIENPIITKPIIEEPIKPVKPVKPSTKVTAPKKNNPGLAKKASK